MLVSKDEVATTSRVACVLAGGRSLERSLERVRLAETLGYEAVFVPQLAGRDALSMVTAFLLGSSTIRVGTGIVPIFARTPAAMAQMAVTMDELGEGRLNLGLGVSHKTMVEGWHGQDMSRPLSAMREYVSIVRAIARGETPPEGDRYQSTFRLEGVDPRPGLRLYVAALSPRMLAMAGQYADGVLVYMCNPDYIRDEVVPAVREGRARAGLGLAGFDIIPIVPAAACDDVDQAVDAVRRDFAPYLMLPFYRSMMERSGHAQTLAAFDAATDDEERRTSITTEFVRQLAVLGSATDIRAGLDSYRAAGANLPVVAPVYPFSVADTLRAASSA